MFRLLPVADVLHSLPQMTVCLTSFDPFGLQDHIIIFGGNEGNWENRPELVEGGWRIATEYLKDYKGKVRSVTETKRGRF